ncbi:3'-5' exonuclease [Hymenobacter metallilatus]|uniref:3'-5' exonuclease n=1 Tax=Hymenobacter metallilatus TaxID=2493666 RepID=A0A3R9M760_9BACT|nr:3'-5' exonuclease [Hymenobacter metallilatus]RSK33935.1 3'-5' exonuclease [Hymenobacter metallilatus]
MSQSSYFKLRTGLSRGVDDATAKKKICVYKDEYFYRDASGRLAQVAVYEDGFVYRSPATYRRDLSKPAADWLAWREGKLKVPKGEQPPFKYAELPGHLLAVPPGALPCTVAEYEAALAKAMAAEKKKADEEAKAKAFAALLKTGKFNGSNEPDPEEVKLVVEAPHFLADFTVLDIEFQGSEMLELAAIRYQNWQAVNQLQTFVRFRGELNFHVATLTGISRHDVWNAPDELAVLTSFRKLAGDSLLVCHNLSADRRILEAARTRQGAREPLPNEWFCTLALSKQRLPKRKHGLGELCTSFGIATHGAHRALRDVEMCFGLLQHLHQLEPINGPLAAKASSKKVVVNQPSLFAAA